MNYLLDTNACLDFLLERSPPLIARVGDAYGRMAVSAVTAAELRVGNRASTDPAGDARVIDAFLTGVEVLPFDEVAATIYGETVRRIGMRRGSFDRLIAAQALSLGLTLVTNNERDFAEIPGLVVENWTR
ncbi:type II toxin-antitoxin system VapC family toxin [Sphingomonas sp. Leaf412]|uniref:type II toxin-antitoxin system VapC family toxin n=1 Tax=Sphingomonas sp. Leaf412 TaxID=1736370 RepID=UPI0009E89DD6|nr:type II toxin-antitoxin system VapC family toxin [Sphingomonas sp. Leaf412]